MEKDIYFYKKSNVYHLFDERKEQEFSLNALGYHNFRFIPPDPYPRKQAFYTLHFIIKGKGILVVNNKKFQLSQYDVFLLDTSSTFYYIPDQKDPWEYVFFEFKGSFVDQYAAFSGFSPTNPKRKCEKPQKILSALKEIFNDDKLDFSYFKTISAFFSLLDSTSQQEKQTTFFYQKDFVAEVKHFIQLNYLSPDFNLQYLCKKMYISHSYLCRVFKLSEKISPVEYVARLKLARAKYLLKSTNYSVQEISFACGFQEYEYFFRFFKRKVGSTPTQYRKKHLKS